MPEPLTPEAEELIRRVRNGQQQLVADAAPTRGKLLSWQRLRSLRKKRDTPRSLTPVAVTLFVVGLVLTVLFLSFMSSTAHQIGGLGELDKLTGKLAGSKEYQELINGSGLSWYRDFFKLYNLRWVISGIVMTFFVVLSALTLMIDLARRGKHE